MQPGDAFARAKLATEAYRSLKSLQLRLLVLLLLLQNGLGQYAWNDLLSWRLLVV